MYLGRTPSEYDGIKISKDGSLTSQFNYMENYAMGARSVTNKYTQEETARNKARALQNDKPEDVEFFNNQLNDFETQGAALSAAFGAGVDSVREPDQTNNVMNDLLQLYTSDNFDQFEDAYKKGVNFETRRQDSESLSGRARDIGQKVSNWIRKQASFEYSHYDY